MITHYFWWIACAILLGAELLTGTFYLAVLAVAALCGAIAAQINLTWETQAILASVVALIGCIAVNRYHAKSTAHSRALDNMDAGQTIRVLEWRDDGSARVAYRGSTWDAELADATQARAEIMAIIGMRGNTLIIGKPTL